MVARAGLNGKVRKKGDPSVGEMMDFISMVNNLSVSRWSLAGYLDQTSSRDIYKECGYPAHGTITAQDYLKMYERNGVGTRVVDIYPDECWALDPVVYETEDTQNETEFEKAWKQLTSNAEEDVGAEEEEGRVNALSYLHRIDQVSGVGSFGVLFMGLDDGRALNKIVPGINERGRPTGQSYQHRLLYMRAFNESQVTIETWQEDPRNPRFGQPQMYKIEFIDPRTELQGSTGVRTTEYLVHWSRVLHVADNRKSSEVFGLPRMLNVYNWLLDLEKTMGGGSEMFYKGGFPGMSLETDPALGNVSIDETKLKEVIKKYYDGLQRYIALKGMKANVLNPNIASPEDLVKSLLMLISIALGVPMRIFIGSEEAKLSSTQDSLAWNKRLGRRQARYLTPQLVRPFVDRLVLYGVLPRPKSYTVSWPDFNTLTDEEKATIAQKRSVALATYVSGNVEAIYPLEHYLVDIVGMPLAQAKIVAQAATDQIRFTEDPNEVALKQTEMKVEGDMKKAKLKDQAAQANRKKLNGGKTSGNRAVKQPRNRKPAGARAARAA